MRLIRLAMLVGLIAAIPICALIYQGVSRLERGVQLSGGMREALRDTAELMNPVLVESGFDADADSELEPAAPYPLTRSIANHAGQSLEVVVTGRDGEVLHFLSLRDNRHYRYPMADLSETDRQFSEKLPHFAPGLDTYPVTRQLSDQRGRTLVALIEGRTQFDLDFRALHDGSRHTYPISRLAATDRDFVFGLPVTRHPPSELSPAGNSKSVETSAPLQTRPLKLNRLHE